MIFQLKKVKIGQVHVSTSSEDATNKLKDALSVERKKNNIALPRIHNPSGQSKRFKEVTEEKLIDLLEKGNHSQRGTKKCYLCLCSQLKKNPK